MGMPAGSFSLCDTAMSWAEMQGCAQVFVNTKSGPQVGAQLRRRFLRLLNPLQARASYAC